MSNLTPLPRKALATHAAADPYAQYLASQAPAGQILKFSKGDWLIGPDKVELPNGHRFVAVPSQTRHGWTYWRDGKVVDRNSVHITEYPAKRSDLGDTDEKTWPMSANGPADPWVYSQEFPLIEQDTDKPAIFSTSSVGGKKAIASVIGEWRRKLRSQPGVIPVVEIGTGVWEHSTYGRIKTPTLTIVDWVADPEAASEPAVPAPSVALDDEVPF